VYTGNCSKALKPKNAEIHDIMAAVACRHWQHVSERTDARQHWLNYTRHFSKFKYQI